MTTFITSDTHFGHSNIIRYCSRPFSDVLEMDAELIRRWNETVGKDDLVWHLGDFSLGGANTIAKYLSQLNGRINLVLGNHDNLNQRQYIQLGFNRVYDRSVIVNGFVILSHAPAEFITESMPYANVFGHVHNQESIKTFTKNTACVCVERWDYRPVPLNDIFARFTANSQENNIK